MCAKSAFVEPEISAEKESREKDHAALSDTVLVRDCINGKEEAWSALIDKYKRLIYSIPIKYSLSSDDANDIFQSVCLDLLSELPKLRKPTALPKWIMQVTAHKCLRHKYREQRMEHPEEGEELPDSAVAPVAEWMLREAEEEQSLREAIAGMQPRCQRLIEMLFFEEPARPYQEIAETLGIATGSIGFIRMRCLDRLRKRLEEAGF
jgi:RNA polymerase sigma factor (sigma-70 family)